MTRRRIALVILAAAVALAAVGHARRVNISMWALQKLADRRLAAHPLAGLADGLHVGLCGAGSPLPDNRRSGPCTVVIAGQRTFLIDAGSGAARNLIRMGFNPGDVEALFLTHFHSDHIDGLGEVMLQRWAGSARQKPLPVYGPTGVDGVVAGFMQAYSLDKSYRIAHHGEQVVPSGGFGGEARSFDVTDPDGRVVLVDEPDLQIVAFSVNHAPVHPAVGYRIRYKDRTVVLSGDTSKCAAVQREARGVDLLVHEALSVPLVAILEHSAAKADRANLARVFRDIPGYHTTPEQAAEIARDAGVGFLLLNHIVPALPPIPGAEAAFLGRAGKIYDGKIQVGVDGDFVSLPAGSKSIEFGNRD
jgi:ribonuclease Z